jgi:hypothetical protein
MFGFGYRQKARRSVSWSVDRTALIRILAIVMANTFGQLSKIVSTLLVLFRQL